MSYPAYARYCYSPTTPPYATSHVHEYRRATTLASATSSSEHAPVGFSNLGNTCFMNAAMQCLLATQNFCTSITREPPKDASRKDLLESFQLLIEDIQRAKRNPLGRERVVAPRGVKAAIGSFKSSFLGYGQHDAQEFLRFVLEGLHLEVNRPRGKPHYEQLDDIDGEPVIDTSVRWWEYSRKRDSSIIYDAFAGQLMSNVTCTVCGTSHLAFDPFLDLSVPIPKSSRTATYRMSQSYALEDCLKRYCDVETLDGADRFHCRKCKQPTRCAKQLQIMRTPEYLLVHLMRFSYGCYKLSDDVHIPHTLDLDPFVFPGSKSLPENERTRYTLYGVINHMGSLGSGHYTSQVCPPNSSTWYSCDDSYVAQLGTRPTISGDKPYILFYKKEHDKVRTGSFMGRADMTPSPAMFIRTPTGHLSRY
eukprot:TRINITY_DN8314_c2_g1_i1.p1 TRINITY_DN8314_c2_g1~~TRINITY_DN8314_c2_g1_i1.p1  ORF type:complete len:420 (+),score=31.88 TRINITY_DN8314_c2_g1_i1:3-1262(+)